MPDILKEICETKRQHIASEKQKYPIEQLEKIAQEQSPPRNFIDSLKKAAENGFGLIAEIKKASPSAGLIRPDFDPKSLAQAYLAGGAACLSVLTDQPYFQGNNDYLKQARAEVHLPILRKDFMLDPWQIIESRAIGADCILLIMAALSDQQAKELEEIATSYGMAVLLEVHDADEFNRAMLLKSPMIGINNRNLKTMQTDINTTVELVRYIPEGRFLISESGLKKRDDLQYLEEFGVKCFLIGESLMREKDVMAATRRLLLNDR